MDAPLFDCHAHIYTLDLPRAPGAWHSPPRDASEADYLAVLRRNGVTHGVLAAASIFADGNRYALDATRRNPNLKTTVIVEAATDLAALRRMKADGAVGIRLQWLGRAPLPDLRSEAYRQLLRHVAALDWHVELHVQGSRLAPMLEALDEAGVKVAIDHFGRPQRMIDGFPEGAPAILRALERGRTWLKVSAGFRLPPEVAVAPLVTAALEAVGPERLLWGSDWPFANFEAAMTYQAALDDYTGLVPDPAVRAAIDRTGLAFYFDQTGD